MTPTERAEQIVNRPGFELLQPLVCNRLKIQIRQAITAAVEEERDACAQIVRRRGAYAATHYQRTTAAALADAEQEIRARSQS